MALSDGPEFPTPNPQLGICVSKHLCFQRPQKSFETHRNSEGPARNLPVIPLVPLLAKTVLCWTYVLLRNFSTIATYVLRSGDLGIQVPMPDFRFWCGYMWDSFSPSVASVLTILTTDRVEALTQGNIKLIVLQEAKTDVRDIVPLQIQLRMALVSGYRIVWKRMNT